MIRRYTLAFSMALLALLSSPVYAQEDAGYAMVGAMVLSAIALLISIAAIVLTSYLVGKKKKED